MRSPYNSQPAATHGLRFAPSVRLEEEKMNITKSQALVAPALSILVIIGINNISRMLGVWNGTGLYVVAFLLFFIMGQAVSTLAPSFRTKVIVIFGTCAGIVFGVIIDSTMDFFLRHYDRNLFPFEIVIWWIFAPIPLLAGILTKQKMNRNT